MKKITTLILASSLLLVATTSVKADDNFEMPTRYVKMSEKSKAFYQRLQEKQRKAHTTVKTFNNSEIRHQLPLKQEKARNDIYNLGILISQESKGSSNVLIMPILWKMSQILLMKLRLCINVTMIYLKKSNLHVIRFKSYLHRIKIIQT